MQLNRKVMPLYHGLSPGPIATRHQCNISSQNTGLHSLNMMRVNKARLWRDNQPPIVVQRRAKGSKVRTGSVCVAIFSQRWHGITVLLSLGDNVL